MSCVAFFLLLLDLDLGETWKPLMLAFVSLLACVEKLCSIMNLVSVEKDWVSSQLSSTLGLYYALN